MYVADYGLCLSDFDFKLRCAFATLLMEWSEGPCSAGPGIVAAGVWGLTVSSNYYEANNGAPPTYSVHGQHHQVTQRL